MGYIHISDTEIHSLAQPTRRPGMFHHIPQISSTYIENYQWIIIDAKVFDISKFKALHPGGLSVLLDPEIGIHSSYSTRLQTTKRMWSSRPRCNRGFL